MRPKNPIPSVKLAQSGRDLGQSVKLGVWQQSIVKIMHIRKIGHSSVTVLSICYLTDGIWNKIHPLSIRGLLSIQMAQNRYSYFLQAVNSR